MMDADPIGNRTLRHRNDSAANNRHDHDAGTITRKRPQFSHAQSEDAREHDRIEETDQEDAVHRRLARGQH